MVNYQNGKIYKIVCGTTGLIYYGSTSQEKLSTRLNGHQKDYKYYLNGKGTFTTSFKVLENNNYTIILIELVPCNLKIELLKRERFYIENNECVNKLIPTQTYKEYNDKNKDKRIKWYKENEEKVKQNKKDYYEKNKQRITEYKKEWAEKNKERLLLKSKIYYKNNQEKKKEYQKEYREQNPEKISEYKKQWYQKNKQKEIK